MVTVTQLKDLAAILLIFTSTALANKIVTFVPDTAVVQPNLTLDKRFDFFRTDFELPVQWSVRPIGTPPVGVFGLKSYPEGSFSFTPADDDSGKIFDFEIIVTDARKMQVVSQFAVRVSGGSPITIQIEKTHGTFGGMWENVSVSKVKGDLSTSSFKLRICYNGEALKFDTLLLSAKLSELGWTSDYSGVSHLNAGPLSLLASSFVVLLHAPQEQLTPLPDGELLIIRFLVSNDRTLECSYVPIYFAWTDCGDNAFTSINADTIYTCLQVVDYDGKLSETRTTLGDCRHRNPVSFSGPCPGPCMSNRRMVDTPKIIFVNGGVDLICQGPVETKGDVNLNGLAYEIADSELMARWLAYGDSVLDINQASRLAQIAMSDANQDGETGSIADIVYLVRVVVGDALPFPKLRPYHGIALIDIHDDTLFVESNDSIAGVLIHFGSSDKTKFENLTSLEMLRGYEGTQSTLLFKPTLDDLTGNLPPGRTPLLRIDGQCQLQDIEVSDYHGNMMNVRR